VKGISLGGSLTVDLQANLSNIYQSSTTRVSFQQNMEGFAHLSLPESTQIIAFARNFTSLVPDSQVVISYQKKETVISPQAPVGRPALGLPLRNTDWFFTFHALASGGGDAGTMAQAVSQYINVNNTSSLHPKWGWTILGDWNRDPGSWDPPSDSFIYEANHATHQGGKELDYMVSSYQMARYQGRVMNGMSSDHFPVEFGSNLE